MTAADQLPAAFRRMIEATNAGDSAAFVDCFAPDAVIDDWGREFTGHEAIAGGDARENIGVHSQIGVEQVTRDGSVFTATISVTGDGYNGGGTFAADVRDGLIERLTIRG